jgi:hypothetical protein
MLRGGLALLWRGCEYARDLDAHGGEFAVECEALYEAGLSAIDLRWLIARGYVETAPAVAPTEGQHQAPSKNSGWKIACFVLTASGAALASEVVSRTLSHFPKCLPFFSLN